MGFMKSSSAPAPVAAPTLVSGGESESDARRSLLEREKRKKGVRYTLLSSARAEGEKGAGNGYKETLG